jgi:5-(carboxyamino)imidazole ribonucleotide mutase
VSVKDKRVALLSLSMTGQKVIVILGSEADQTFAAPIKPFLDRFNVQYEFRVASAHKEPRRLLQMLEGYERLDEKIVFITIAGRSNALSGFVDFQTRHPVIACPPQSENLWHIDVYSSLRMPKGVASLVTCDPENAALAALKILGETDSSLSSKITQYQRELQSRNEKADQISSKARIVE